ncbi:Helix-turn-helix domain protein [Bacteroidales bacterium Barb6XT]|nr:Helix-turn-helix domain protein [Bacteroidales bacterium Barb6XT]
MFRFAITFPFPLEPCQIMPDSTVVSLNGKCLRFSLQMFFRIDLASQFPEISLTIKAADLIDMVNYCVSKTRQELEQQITDANTETYPSKQQVMQILGVSKPTLSRWNKSGYLMRVTVGGTRRYRMSDIQRILGVKEAGNK